MTALREAAQALIDATDTTWCDSNGCPCRFQNNDDLLKTRATQ